MTDLRDRLPELEAAARRLAPAVQAYRAPIRLPRHQDVGALLRELRHAAGLSLRDLAPAACVSKAGLSKREKRGGITVGALVDHARALGYDVALIPRAGALTPDRRSA